MPTSSQRRLPGSARQWPGKLLLLTVSAVLSLLAGLLLLKGYEVLLGAHIPHDYFVEPRPVLWQPDPEVGFRNRAHLTHRVFGRLDCHTNGAGFRARREFSPAAPSGTFRIIGVGDSVMWGSGVSQEDSFLGTLERLLAEDHPAPEVINAGVAGYSTYQERLILESRILPYAPDLVLINFFPNDYLPTEDPFGNVREVYTGYLQSLDAPDAKAVTTISSILKSPHAWNALGRANRDPAMQRALREVLIDRPIVEMARIARERGVRLLYLLIPPTLEKKWDRILRLQIRRILADNEIEFIDLSAALREDKEIYMQIRRFEEGLLPRVVEGSGIRDLLSALSLGALDPIPSLRNISRLRGIQSAHEQRNYIDGIGHPSRRGSRIIAEEIRDYLAMQRPLPPSGQH